MHACGHDVHLAALAALARSAPVLPVALLVVLQPREEQAPSGAQDIVASGRLAAHDVRAAIGVHVQPQLPRGTVAADSGVVNAALDHLTVTITGHGGHAGYPHLTRDPVPALCQTVLALLDVARTSVDPMHPATLSIGALQAGGSSNVVPDTATARGTIRTFDAADRDRLLSRVRACAAGIAAAHGCAADVLITTGEPALHNDPALTAATRGWLTVAGFGGGREFRSCGSDDFAAFTAAVPGVMVFLGAAGGPDAPMLHDARFLPPDEQVGEVARAMLAGYLGAVTTLDADRSR
jgi:amidohydrolase